MPTTPRPFTNVGKGAGSARHWPPPSQDDGLSPPPARRPMERERPEEPQMRAQLPVMGVHRQRTLVVRDSANIITLIIHSPRLVDGSRYHQRFILDRNATLSESMQYVYWLWELGQGPARFDVLRLDDANEPLRRVVGTDVVQDIIPADCESFEIFVSLDTTPEIGPLKQRAGFHAVGGSRSDDATLLPLLFTFRGRGLAQLIVDPTAPLSQAAALACLHFDQDMRHARWFVGEREAVGDWVTPACVGMIMNQHIRMYTCEDGNFEFYLE